MSIVAEFTIGTEGLVLEQTLQSVEARVDAERTIATDPKRPVVFMWVETDEPERFETEMETDPTVAHVQRLSTVDGRRLYRVQLTEETETVLYPVWFDLGAEQLEAYHADGRWHLRMRFPDRKSFAEYESYLTSVGLQFQLKRLYDSAAAPGSPGGRDGLTEEQRETLLLAYERGLFDIPRRATAADLASELGVSRQAVSERLRRGYATLVERHLK